VLAHYHRLRPDVSISLHNMTKSEQMQALRERRLTVGFARLVPSAPDLAVEIVLREPMLVALYEGHPLCSKAEITTSDLDDEPMILYPNFSMSGLAQSVMEAFTRSAVRLRIEQKVEDVLTAIALVSSGYGLCVTTESASSLRLPGVTYRPFHSPFLNDIEMNCFYRRDDQSPVLHALLEVVRRYGKRGSQ
jgi:DNA-binding transcriptional LysR family regulator